MSEIVLVFEGFSSKPDLWNPQKNQPVLGISEPMVADLSLPLCIFPRFLSTTAKVKKQQVKNLLVFFSFVMAFNLIACTSYGLVQLNAEELVENITLQELLEEEMNKKNEYMRPVFSLNQPLTEELVTFYFAQNSNGFSSFVQEIHVPPPNFTF